MARDRFSRQFFWTGMLYFQLAGEMGGAGAGAGGAGVGGAGDPGAGAGAGGGLPAGAGAGGAGAPGGAGGGGGGAPPSTITIDFGKLPSSTQELFKSRGWEPGKEGVGEVISTSFEHANRALSGAKDVIALPGDNASPEQRNAFLKTLGRPDTPEGYKFEAPAGITLDPEVTAWTGKVFHEAGLPQDMAGKVFQGLQTWAAKTLSDGVAAANAEAQAQVNAIKQELGSEYEPLKQKGEAILKAAGITKDDLDWIDSQKGTGPILRLLTTLGKRMGEGGGGFIQDGQGGGNFPGNPAGMSSTQAEGEINRLGGDPEFQKAYTGKDHPEHAQAVKRMEALYAAKARKAA